MNGQPDRSDTDDAESEAPEPDAEEALATEQTDPMAELQQKVDENWEKYVRAAAELENVRKRAARDVDNARKYALERFSTELLAVRDSLEMALTAGGDVSVESLMQGTQATEKQLISVLNAFGIQEVDPQGEPFDPALHEAVAMQPSTEVEPGSIVTVFQKGYVLNERLLRAARVVVAAETEEDSEET